MIYHALLKLQHMSIFFTIRGALMNNAILSFISKLL